MHMHGHGMENKNADASLYYQLGTGQHIRQGRYEYVCVITKQPLLDCAVR